MKRKVLLAAAITLAAIGWAAVPSAGAQSTDSDTVVVVKPDGRPDRPDRPERPPRPDRPAPVPAVLVTQDIEQEIDETGDVDQTFDMTGAGDNANRCVGVQGAANTGNAQSGSEFLQYSSEIEEFESEDEETSLSVDPESSVTCDQQVNQAAAAG